MTVLAPTARVRKPNPVTQSYTALAQAVRDKGLLSRTRWFYGVLLIGLGLALGGVVTGVILLGDSWFQLLMAGGARHPLHPVRLPRARGLAPPGASSSGPANDRHRPAPGGRLRRHQLLVVDEQAHASPRQPEQAGQGPRHRDRHHLLRGGERGEQARRPWPGSPVARAVLLPAAAARGHQPAPQVGHRACGTHAPRRRVDGSSSTVLVARFALYLTRCSWSCRSAWPSPSSACSSPSSASTWAPSFAPNHNGMPIVGRDVKLDFFSKQVLTSRNVSGGWWATALMGGLNYQIEHHLFPSMPRPHLAVAAPDGARALPPARRALHRDHPARSRTAS